jgi:hypothetical protein
MSDYVWSAVCFLVWFCSSPWHVTALVAVCLAAVVWLGTRDPRDMRTEAAAIDAEENGAPWADNAGGGDGWPVDIDAQAALYAHIDAAERLDLCELLWAMPAYDFIGEEDPR